MAGTTVLLAPLPKRFVQWAIIVSQAQLLALCVQLGTTACKVPHSRQHAKAAFTASQGKHRALNALQDTSVCMLTNLQSSVTRAIIALLAKLIAACVQKGIFASREVRFLFQCQAATTVLKVVQGMQRARLAIIVPRVPLSRSSAQKGLMLFQAKRFAKTARLAITAPSKPPTSRSAQLETIAPHYLLSTQNAVVAITVLKEAQLRLSVPQELTQRVALQSAKRAREATSASLVLKHRWLVKEARMQLQDLVHALPALRATTAKRPVHFLSSAQAELIQTQQAQSVLCVRKDTSVE